jgi:CRP-like cAMP-binding protein
MSPDAYQRQPTPYAAAAAEAMSAADAASGLQTHHPVVSPEAKTLCAGQLLYEAGRFTADVWRIEGGALRLDLVGDGHVSFVQLAVQGDHLGLESHCGLPTMFRATAVTRCLLRRLAADGERAQRALISGALVQQWCRAADQIAFRSGSAAERVRQLLLLLAGGAAASADGFTPIELPRLSDIAAIVDSAPETVSRILSHWRHQGVLLGAGASPGRLDCRRLAACEISKGITSSVARGDAGRLRGTPSGGGGHAR